MKNAKRNVEAVHCLTTDGKAFLPICRTFPPCDLESCSVFSLSSRVCPIQKWKSVWSARCGFRWGSSECKS